MSQVARQSPPIAKLKHELNFSKRPPFFPPLFTVYTEFIAIIFNKGFTVQYQYSRVRNKHSPTIINFLTFFQGLRPYSRLHRSYFSSISIRYKWGYAYSFCQIFQGLRLFKGLRLFQTLEYVTDWDFGLFCLSFNKI